jgi:hypothetical protein
VGARRIRLLPSLAAGFLLAAAVALPATASAGSHTLLPDLRTLLPTDLEMRSDDPLNPGATELRLSNTIANEGTGPLEIFPSATSENCDGDGNPDNDRSAYQRTFRDTSGDGVYERNKDTDSAIHFAGCMRFHAEHGHWHFDNFSKYVLRRESDGTIAGRSTKVSFCVIDGVQLFNKLPGSPKRNFYPEGGAGCTATATEGLSIGWADTYGSTLPGQDIYITGLPSAMYCLISMADPRNRLRERNDSNNAFRERVRLDFDAGAAIGLPGDCSLGK